MKRGLEEALKLILVAQELEVVEVLDVCRPSIQMINELGEVDIDNSCTFKVKSEGIERFIKDINTLEVESGKSEIEEAFIKSFNFGELKAQLLYLVYTSRAHRDMNP